MMSKQVSLIGLASVLTLSLSSAASAGSSYLWGDSGLESFATSGNLPSFAWAGEDETFAAPSLAELLPMSPQAVQFEDGFDVELITGVPAPEPPAIVLAGLAFGGVLCGRSVLTRRRKVSECTPASEIAA